MSEEVKLESRVVSDTLAKLPIDKIFENQTKLRSVDLENPDFQRLVDSVRVNGVIQPIQVREYEDKETGDKTYGLINGLQRFTAAKMCGFTEINAVIRNIDDIRTLEEQIITNGVSVETKPAEYGKALRSLMSLDPSLTVNSLAARVGHDPTWIKARLSLQELHEEIAKLVDDGVIKIVNAVALATLPVEVQHEYIAAASTQPASEFASIVKERRDAIRKAKLAQRPEELTFSPTATMRKFGDVKAAMGDVQLASKCVADNGCTTTVDAFLAGILWTLQLDKESVATKKADFDKRVADAKAKAENAKADRAQRGVRAGELKVLENKLRLKLMDEGKTEEEIEKAVKEMLEAEKAKDKEAAK